MFLKGYLKLCSQYARVKTKELVKKNAKMYHTFQSLLWDKVCLNIKTLWISWAKIALSLYSRENMSSKIAWYPLIPVERYHVSDVTPYHLRNDHYVFLLDKKKILIMGKYTYIK